MKLLAFILSFLVLGMSCLPCADADGHYSKGEVVSQEDHRDTEAHEDACSPFCHCTCCAGFSFNQVIPSISGLNVFGDKNFSSYLPDNLVEVSLPVWQPPQLS